MKGFFCQVYFILFQNNIGLYFMSNKENKNPAVQVAEKDRESNI